MNNRKNLAVCGLLCNECDTFKAPKDPKIAKKLAEQFEGMWENVKPEDFHCNGCRGDRLKCWTTECWIRECCIDNKDLAFCYECQEFPCDRLKEWANKNNRYKEALNNLKNLKLKKRS